MSGSSLAVPSSSVPSGSRSAQSSTGNGITVVIATRNRADELANTLDRLHALIPRPPIIVLDNASTDDTAARVAEFSGVRHVRLSRNAGAAARNIGVELADTPYVAFADDDSWWAPDALSRAEATLDRHPRLGLIAARTLVGPDERTDPTNELMARSPLGHDLGLPGPSVLGFLACSAVVRVAAFRQAGGFSSLLHFGAEETLLAYDLAASGWALCYVEDIRAHHHPSPVRSAPAARRRLEQRNNLMITWMRRPVAVGLRASVDLLRQVPGDPGSVSALAGAVRRLPWVLSGRERLPDRVEHDVRLLRIPMTTEVTCPA